MKLVILNVGTTLSWVDKDQKLRKSVLRYGGSEKSVSSTLLPENQVKLQSIALQLSEKNSLSLPLSGKEWSTQINGDDDKVCLEFRDTTKPYDKGRYLEIRFHIKESVVKSISTKDDFLFFSPNKLDGITLIYQEQP